MIESFDKMKARFFQRAKRVFFSSTIRQAQSQGVTQSVARSEGWVTNSYSEPPKRNPKRLIEEQQVPQAKYASLYG